MGASASDEKRCCVEGKRARSAAASVVTLLKDIDAAVCDSQETLNLSYLWPSQKEMLSSVLET